MTKLVAALTAPAGEQSRLDLVEEAITCAYLAMGSEAKIDPDAIQESMEQLSAEVFVDKLAREEATVMRLSVKCAHGREAASIVATVSPDVAVRLDAACENKPMFYIPASGSTH